MPARLYRPGTSHFYNGVACEIGLFDPSEVGYMLARGWYTSTSRFPNDEEDSEAQSDHIENVKESIGNGSKPVKKARATREEAALLRHHAQRLGVDGWDTKPLPTLRVQVEREQLKIRAENAANAES